MSEQEQSRSKLGSAQRRDIIFAVAVIVIVFLFQRFNQTDPILFQFDETGMAITGPAEAGFSVEIEYQDILSLAEADSLDPGTNLTGVNTDKCWFGTWQNSAYGEYTLCASPTFSQYIVLETADGIVVCNYENAETTQSLYTALLELLETKQQEG